MRESGDRMMPKNNVSTIYLTECIDLLGKPFSQIEEVMRSNKGQLMLIEFYMINNQLVFAVI